MVTISPEQLINGGHNYQSARLKQNAADPKQIVYFIHVYVVCVFILCYNVITLV